MAAKFTNLPRSMARGVTGRLLPDMTVALRFDKPGSYTYICKNHPWAYGQIIVVEKSAATAGHRTQHWRTTSRAAKLPTGKLRQLPYARLERRRTGAADPLQRWLALDFFCAGGVGCTCSTKSVA